MHNFREIKPVYGQVDRPLRKREPLYKFLKTTMEKTDVNKQKIRNIMSSVVWKFCQKHGNKVCRMLTMPGTEWIFEKMLRTNLLRSGIRSSITACELDYKVFCIACANAPGTKTRNPYFSNKLNHYVMTNVKNQIYMLNMDIFDLMSSDTSNPDRKLDFVWLDTTNTIISIARRLPRIDKIMAENSIIAITAVKGREQERIYMSRDEYISGLLEPMGFKLKERIDYMDTSPMCHFIYVREK